MSIKKIIFLTESFFFKRDYDRFGIQVLKENGFIVELWDLTPFLQPELYRGYKNNDSFKYEYYRLFIAQENAITALRKLRKDCFIVCLIGYNFKSYCIYRTISRNKLPYALCLVSGTPLPSGKLYCSFVGKIRKIFKEPQRALHKVANRLFLPRYCKFMGIKSANIVLLGGARSVDYLRHYPVDEKTEKLWGHALDYDLYLEKKKALPQTTSNVAVFLDEYVPFHPDYLLANVESFSSPDEYYPILCKFFDKVEQVLGLNVVVAAHPKSNYNEHPDYFCGRAVIKGKTMELVKEAKLVIAHSSTSIFFSVLFRKPLVIITTDSLDQSPQRLEIDAMAVALNKKIININRKLDLDLNDELLMDDTVYSQFKEDYIKKMDSEDLPLWQMFANRVKSFL